MSTQVIRQLVAKDWHFNRKWIVAFFAAGAISLALLAMPSTGSFQAGSVLLLSALFGIGAQLVFTTVLYERRDQTLAFVMTLPVSNRDYTTAKILANVVIFGGAWLILLVGTVLLILLRDTLPDGLVPYACIVLVQTFIAYLLMLLVAIILESEGWAIAAMVLGSFLLQGVMFSVPQVQGVAAAISSNNVVWSPVMTFTLLAQIALIALLLIVTFWSQAKKRDFL